mgnify:FL=1
MFTDARSKKVILVSHCILNQNVKIDRCAWYAGAMREVTQTLLDAGMGLLQMPCPELLALGLDRQVEKGAPTSIESEDDRVSDRMNEEGPRQLCAQIARDLVYQIEQYQHNGFTVLGVLGINGSPTCGVESGWSNGVETSGHGVLIQALADELATHKIALPMRGIKASQPEQAVAAVLELLEKDNS